MLGGADNPNGELLSYIIGADKVTLASLVRVSAHYEVTLMYRATEPSVSPRNRLQSFWIAWVSAMASPHLMHLDMLQSPACKLYVRGKLEH